MGLIAKLLSFARATRNGANVSDAKVDPGGGYNLTLQHFGAPGDDSHPVPGDYVASVEVPQHGGAVAVGYVDPKNTGRAKEGERRLYARNEAGEATVELWLMRSGTIQMVNALGAIYLRADGSTRIEGPGAEAEFFGSGAIVIKNGAGSFDIAPAGVVTINGVTIDPAGNISTPGNLSVQGTAAVFTSISAPMISANSVKAAGQELAGHYHANPNDSRGDSQGPTGPNLP